MSQKNQRRAASKAKMSTLAIENRFMALLQAGTEALHRGRVEDAIHRLDLAHQLQPDNPDAAHNLSSAYILRGRFSKALPLLQKLVADHPDNANFWLNLGAAHLGNPVLATDEQQQQAIAAFQHALSLNPAIPNAAYNIGLIYRDRDDKVQALHWFQKAIQTNPNDQHAHNILRKLQQDEEE